MKPARRLALVALALCAPLVGMGCELVLTEHRSGKLLQRVALDPDRLTADIAFTHSVLGTPVLDRYVWRHGPSGWRAYLVEERFQGEGYGLATSAGPGETLTRENLAGGTFWRLRLKRLVDPLVVLPLPEQAMRVVLADQREVLLGSISRTSVEFRAENCPVPPPMETP
ncbi:MAG: DUF1850 domain-containing protein [Rhodoferax sp.]|nr:DUF1850 domain-containing protein [Rhodoferax sp.]MCF8208698.1 DUF1850 domain-containing protein [Rhodoferax sp.]